MNFLTVVQKEKISTDWILMASQSKSLMLSTPILFPWASLWAAYWITPVFMPTVFKRQQGLAVRQLKQMLQCNFWTETIKIWQFRILTVKKSCSEMTYLIFRVHGAGRFQVWKQGIPAFTQMQTDQAYNHKPYLLIFSNSTNCAGFLATLSSLVNSHQSHTFHHHRKSLEYSITCSSREDKSCLIIHLF